MGPFEPLFRNAHLATLAGNFWTRPELETRWPVTDVYYEPEPGVRTLARMQKPRDAPAYNDRARQEGARPKGEVILVHGLEGSSESGYMRSMAAAALAAGFIVHRLNMRGCGSSPWHRKANYHSGQTGDLLHVARERRQTLDTEGIGNPSEKGLPLFAIGYSLGGNQVLKLAGELGDEGRTLFDGVCAVSAPIDLAASATALARPTNFLYQRRFVKRLKERVRKRNPLAPDLFPLGPLAQVKSIYDFDDQYTAKLFGFGTADRYYETQSSRQFLERIRVPTLLVQAKDDPMVPFASYEHPAVRANPHVRLLAVAHGGHLGFLARGRQRFWLDHLLTNWMLETRKLPSEAKAAGEVTAAAETS